MAVAIDASSPALASGDAAAGTTTTAAFNPPAGSYLVALVGLDNDAVVTGSITDNKGGGWTLLKRDNNWGGVEVWGKALASAQTGMTVSLTATSGWSGTQTAKLKVVVLTGSSGPGASASGATGNINSVSITPSASGSMLLGGIVDNARALAYTANAASTSQGTWQDATASWGGMFLQGTNPTTASTPVALGFTQAVNSQRDAVAVEFLASGASTTPVGRSLTTPFTVRQRAGRSLTTPHTVRQPAGRSLTTPHTVRQPAGRSLTTPFSILALGAGEFPANTTSIDDFNRANNPANIGAGAAIWRDTGIIGSAHLMNVASNAITGNAGDELISVNDFGPDVDFQFTVVQKGSSYLAFFFAMQPGGAGSYPSSVFSGYALTIGLGAADEWAFRSYTNGGGAQISGSAVTQTFAAGDQIGVSMRGSTLSAYRKPSGGGSWTLITQITDTDHNRAGGIGYEVGGGTSQIFDDLRGGTVSATTAVGRSLTQPYTVRSAVGRALTAPYSVRQTAGRSLTTPHTVRVPVGRSLTQPLAVRAPVGRSLTQGLAVRALAGRALSTPFTIRAPVGRSLAAPFSVRSAAGRSLDQPFGITEAIGQSLDQPFEILGPPLSTLHDTFSGPSLDPSRWDTGGTDPRADVSVVDGRVRLTTYSEELDAGRAKLNSVEAFELDAIHVEVDPATAPTWLAMTLSGTDGPTALYIAFEPAAVAESGEDTFWFGGNLGSSFNTPIPYDPVAHRWWRIRLDGSTARFEASPDGGTWTEQGSHDWTGAPRGYWVDVQNQAAPGFPIGEAYIDNVNVSPVGRSLATPYTVRAPAGSSLAQPFTVYEAVGRSLTQPYDVASALFAVGRSLTQPFVVRQPAGRSLTAPFSVRVLAGRSLPQGFVVRELAGRSLTTTYAIRALAGRSLTTPYTVRALAGRSLDQGYVLRSLAARSLTQGFVVRQQAGRALTQPYAIRAVTGRSLDQPFAVRISAGRTLGMPLTIRELAGRSLDQPFVLIGAIYTVGRSLGQPFQVRQLAGRGLAQPFVVLTAIGRSLDQGFVLRELAGRSVGQPFIVRQPAGRSLGQVFSVRQHVGRGLAQPFAVRITVARSLEAPYVIRQLAGSSLTQPLSVRVHAGRALTQRFSIAKHVGRSLGQPYAFRGPAGLDAPWRTGSAAGGMRPRSGARMGSAVSGAIAMRASTVNGSASPTMRPKR